MKKKTYIPIWYNVTWLLISAAYIIVVFVMGPPSGRMIRMHVYHRTAYILWMPIIIWTIYTLNCRVTIVQEYIKIKYPTCMGFFPKIVKYDDIEKVEIERYEGKKPHYQYHFFLKNSHKFLQSLVRARIHMI